MGLRALLTELAMRIKATPIKASELKPGDLFSARGSDYWDDFGKKRSVGESVYIRTHADAESAPDPQTIVYKIEIEDV